jgi:hypothetical protein
MSSTPTATVRRGAHTPPAVRGWIFGGLALAWYAISTFGPLELPGFAVVFVLGVLVMLSLEPDVRSPTQGVTRTRWNLILALPTAVAFVPLAIGMNPLLGRIPTEAGHALLATLAAVCVALPRLAETRELVRPAMLGHRELVIGVTALVAGVRACCGLRSRAASPPPARRSARSPPPRLGGGLAGAPARAARRRCGSR